MTTALAGIATGFDELVQWLAALDRPFTFLLALPFIVALAGLAAEIVKQHRRKTGELPK